MQLLQHGSARSRALLYVECACGPAHVRLAPVPAIPQIWLDEVSPLTSAVVSNVGPLVGNTPNSLPSVALSSAFPRDGLMQLSADGGVLTFLAMGASSREAGAWFTNVS